jgi:hypothetical protein
MREKPLLQTLHTKGFELGAASLLDALNELGPSGKSRALLSSTIVSTMVSSCKASVIWSTDMTPDQDVIVVR